MKSQWLLCLCLLLLGTVLASCASLVDTTPDEPALPTPIKGFTFADYGLAQYGLTFNYPEHWQLSDMGDALALNNHNHSLTMIFFETGNINQFEYTDPIDILNNDYPVLALGTLKEERTILEVPSEVAVNGQKAAVMALEALPFGEATSVVKGFVGIIIDEERYVLAQGVTLPQNANKFSATFDQIFNSIELGTPAGVPVILPDTIYQQTKAHIGRPLFYRFTAIDSNPLTIMTKAEGDILSAPSLSVYTYDEDPYLQELLPDQENLLAETGGPVIADWAALVFEPEQGKEYLIEVGTNRASFGDFSVYLMRGVPNSQLSEIGRLTTGEVSELSFQTKANTNYLISAQSSPDVDIRFEIQDNEGNRVRQVDYATTGEIETYTLVSETDGDYILKIDSITPTGEGEYVVSVGETTSVFSE